MNDLPKRGVANVCERNRVLRLDELLRRCPGSHPLKLILGDGDWNAATQQRKCKEQITSVHLGRVAWEYNRDGESVSAPLSRAIVWYPTDARLARRIPVAVSDSRCQL